LPAHREVHVVKEFLVHLLQQPLGEPIWGVVLAKVVAHLARKEVVVEFFQKVAGLVWVNVKSCWVVLRKARHQRPHGRLDGLAVGIEVPREEVALEQVLDPELAEYAALLHLAEVGEEVGGRGPIQLLEERGANPRAKVAGEGEPRDEFDKEGEVGVQGEEEPFRLVRGADLEPGFGGPLLEGSELAPPERLLVVNRLGEEELPLLEELGHHPLRLGEHGPGEGGIEGRDGLPAPGMLGAEVAGEVFRGERGSGEAGEPPQEVGQGRFFGGAKRLERHAAVTQPDEGEVMAIEHDAPQPAVAFPLGDRVHVLGHLIARISERARRSEGAWALELDHEPAEDRVRPRPFGDDVLVALVRG